ncbi:MAG: alpha/beta fold hydrolase [Devosia sp.]
MKTFLRILRWAALALFLAIVGLTASMVRFDADPAALEATYATPPSRFVVADGVRFHTRDRGAGPVIVLIHGQSANLFGWEAWAEDLARDYRVIAVDLPGHGLTGPDPQSRYSWAGLATSLGALTDELGLDRFTLVGNSLGGAVALSYALARPQQVERLVLLDAIGAPREEPKPPIFEAYATPVLGQALTFLTPEWIVRQSLESTYGDPAIVTDAEVTQFRAMMLRAGNREAARQIVAYVPDGEIERRIGEVTMPTLVIWGGRDTWTLPKYADWFDDHLPNADVVMFDDLGHMPQVENPARTVAALRDFLGRS